MDDCEMRLIYNAGEVELMDIEKPVKVALDGAVIVVDTHEPIDVSAATLIEMVEMVKSVKATNDKFYEIIYKDGNWLLYPDEIPTSRDSFCSFCGQKIDWSEVCATQSNAK